MDIGEFDNEQIRCPRIGGDVIFKFCRASGAPFCRVIINCWAPRLDIGQFLADNYTAEQIHQGMARPEKGKIERLVGLMPEQKGEE